MKEMVTIDKEFEILQQELAAIKAEKRLVGVPDGFND